MAEETCDICGSTNIKEIKCKLICQNCGAILRSCADLSEGAADCGLTNYSELRTN